MKMKVEKIESKEEITDNSKEDFFRSLIMGDSITEEIETSRGKFKILFVSNKEQMMIDRLVSARRNGIPSDSFDIYSKIRSVSLATLDIAVLEGLDGADWYNEAKDENKNFAWEVVPDEKLVTELFDMVQSFRKKVYAAINGDTTEESSTDATDSGSESTMGGGVFSGITNRFKDKKSKPDTN